MNYLGFRVISVFEISLNAEPQVFPISNGSL